MTTAAENRERELHRRRLEEVRAAWSVGRGLAFITFWPSLAAVIIHFY